MGAPALMSGDEKRLTGLPPSLIRVELGRKRRVMTPSISGVVVSFDDLIAVSEN